MIRSDDVVVVGDDKVQLIVNRHMSGRWETHEVLGILQNLERAAITRAQLDETGLARELRLWIEHPVISQKHQELVEKAREVFEKWRKLYYGKAASRGSTGTTSSAGGSSSTSTGKS